MREEIRQLRMLALPRVSGLLLGGHFFSEFAPRAKAGLDVLASCHGHGACHETPESSTSDLEAAAEATPRIRLAVEMIPSFAPSTAALSHPIRSTRWLSL
jgi:hypothetical protein